MAVLEAQVELLRDGQREAGDFAVASHRGLGGRSIVSMRAHENKNASRGETYRRFLRRAPARGKKHSALTKRLQSRREKLQM